MRILRSLANARMAPHEEQRAGIADLGFDETEIAGRVEKTGVPTFPVGQKLFYLFAETHTPQCSEATGPIQRRFREIERWRTRRRRGRRIRRGYSSSRGKKNAATIATNTPTMNVDSDGITAAGTAN